MILPQIEHIEKLFKTNSKFTDKEGKLFIPKILDAIDKIDKDLVKLIMSDEKAKKQFFISIDDVYVLNQNDLIEFFTMNEYFNHSFTSYTNKIGLIKKDNFIKKFDDVVLAFPYKDCVLEGGQTKDDEKNSEVFYNAIISRDEIDRLLEPKVLTHIKRFDKDGEHEVEEIKEDDNLIIKGNNLLALHSLKKRYAGKVKLIYIDPPYNTGSDSFGYNDSFNHSTWLTFMKNRLEVAREFLSEDGVIFVSIDDNEQAYLKVLMDEVFGRENFVATIIKQSKVGGGSDTKHIVQEHEYIIVFAKTINNLSKMYIAHDKEYLKRYKEKDENGYYFWDTFARPGLKNPINYDIKMPDGTILNGDWIRSEKRFQNDYKNGDMRLLKKNDGQWTVHFKQRLNINGKKPRSIALDLGGTIEGKKDFMSLFNNSSIVFAYPKSVKTIRHLLEIINDKESLVLDFHAGSGTTAQAVLDLNKEDGGNRKFILIEQMDYIEDITCERVKKVIENNNQGDFIYAELKAIHNFSHSPIGQLNKNMQYLPISEIEDEEYAISQKEIVINKKFYGIDDE
ncbi:site-specific DNA-methyltransferase [bacterium]|nr:site-specific DNA-methyltransferase [bacterium]MBU1958386.1 site-specific DNA-methyltransferase [bacterium]